MKFSDLLEQFRFDKRLVDWNIKHGVINNTDLEKHLSTVTDSSHNLSQIQIDGDSADDQSH